MKTVRDVLKVLCIIALFFGAENATIRPASALYYPEDFKWAGIKKFSGSGQRYSALRSRVDSLVMRGTLPLTLYQNNLPAAKRGDIGALYVVGLCSVYNWKYGKDLWLDKHILSERTFDLVQRTSRLSSGYEFMRMRFLLASRVGHDRQLLHLGRLLLENQSNDKEVEFRYSRLLIDSSQTKSDRKVALRYVLRLKKRYPAEKDGVRSQLADIYMRLANMGEDPTARHKEIAIYNEILRDYRNRPQTPQIKEYILNTEYRLKAARGYKAKGK